MLAASKTLGHIVAEIGPAFGEQLMDFEVQAAIGLIQPDKPESPRYAGVLILKELAKNSPTYFHAHIGTVFDSILVPLRDQRVLVREGAAELLANCLDIVTQRERQARSPHLSKMLLEAQLGLKQSQPEIIHASLLTYLQLLLHAGMVSVCSVSTHVLPYNYFFSCFGVYEGELFGYRGAGVAVQGAPGPGDSEDGDHYDPVASCV